MKKLILSMIAIAAMASCTTTSEDEFDPNAPVEIKMNASIGVVARSAVNSISDAIVKDFGFIRADGAQNANVDDLTWGTDLLSTTVDGKGNITFDTPQYYDVDADIYAHFVGIYPKSALAAGNIGTFIPDSVKDGQHDIMYASIKGGNRNTAAISSTFDHKLSQLKFKFTKDSELTTLGTVTSMTIKGIKLPESINYKTGDIKYATDPVANGINLTFKNGAYDSAQEAEEVMLVQPGASDLTADITLSDGQTFKDIKLSVTTEVGTAHTITLKFQKKAVSSTAAVSPWKTKDAGETPVM